MVIISDTSPMTALLLAGRGELLTSLFERVVIPPAVASELLRAHASLPGWMEVTIALALELHPDTMLMDERLGRRLARRHGLPVTGLLGLLTLAKSSGLITEIVPVIREFQDKGNCWFGQQLINDVCAAAGEVWH